MMEKTKVIKKKTQSSKKDKPELVEDTQLLLDTCYFIKELMESTRIDSNSREETKWISVVSNEDCDKLKLILEKTLKKITCL